MTLVIGYGNPMRSDDAAGIYAVNEITKKKIPGVVTATMQQIQVELLEEAVYCDKVIFVDAGTGGDEVSVKKIRLSASELVSTHHLSPELFLQLAKSIYEKDLDLYVCSIKGENFAVGNLLSAETAKRVRKAVDMVCSLVSEASYARS